MNTDLPPLVEALPGLNNVELRVSIEVLDDVPQVAQSLTAWIEAEALASTEQPTATAMQTRQPIRDGIPDSAQSRIQLNTTPLFQGM